MSTDASTSVAVLTKPGAGASSAELADFIHNQLDRILLGVDGKPFPILYGLMLQGCGPRDRMQGGAQHETDTFFFLHRLKDSSFFQQLLRPLS